MQQAKETPALDEKCKNYLNPIIFHYKEKVALLPSDMQTAVITMSEAPLYKAIHKTHQQHQSHQLRKCGWKCLRKFIEECMAWCWSGHIYFWGEGWSTAEGVRNKQAQTVKGWSPQWETGDSRLCVTTYIHVASAHRPCGCAKNPVTWTKSKTLLMCTQCKYKYLKIKKLILFSSASSQNTLTLPPELASL